MIFAGSPVLEIWKWCFGPQLSKGHWNRLWWASGPHYSCPVRASVPEEERISLLLQERWWTTVWVSFVLLYILLSVYNKMFLLFSLINKYIKLLFWMNKFPPGGQVQKYSYQFGTSPTCSRKPQYANYTGRNRMVRQAGNNDTDCILFFSFVQSCINLNMSVLGLCWAF